MSWTKRVVTVLIGFPLVIALLWHPLASTALVVGISCVAHYEWLFTLSPLIVERLNNHKDHGAEVAGMSMVSQSLQLAFGTAIVLAATVPNKPWLLDAVVGTALAATCFIHVAAHQKRRPTATSAVALGLHAFGLVYVPWNAAHFVQLRGMDGGAVLLPWYIVCVWNCDNGAILAGRAFGRVWGCHPFPFTSPGKTAAGLFGGTTLCVVSALILPSLWRGYGLPPGDMPGVDALAALPWPAHAGVGIALAVIGTLGDLVASLLKRAAGVKNSGSLVPGHGGAIDRTDSLLLGVVLWHRFVAALSQA